jgi:hypothetical protein
MARWGWGGVGWDGAASTYHLPPLAATSPRGVAATLPSLFPARSPAPPFSPFIPRAPRTVSASSSVLSKTEPSPYLSLTLPSLRGSPLDRRSPSPRQYVGTAVRAEDVDYEAQFKKIQKEAEERLDDKVEEMMKNIDAVGSSSK